MEINSKQLLAMAAIGGAIWYLMRKDKTVAAATKPAVAPAAGTGGIWDGFGVGGSLSDAMGQVQAPAPAPNKPAPAPTPTANTPWTMQPTASGEVQWDGKGGWLQSNGQPVAEGYALGHLTPEQRRGRTDAQIITQFA